MTSLVAREAWTRTRMLVGRLEGLDLETPSLLPGWSRLTIVCHLRYGAEAMRQMTIDATAGRPASYYPEGRATQRPGTLVPRPGESPADVVASLHEASAALDTMWSAVEDWPMAVREPDDNVDLGPIRLLDLPMFRLTEIEVHGTDLDVGMPDWTDTLIRSGLVTRIERLARRQQLVPGAWRLIAEGGPLDGLDETVGDGSEPEVIRASSRELFALTLGRIHLSDSFAAAFPGP